MPQAVPLLLPPGASHQQAALQSFINKLKATTHTHGVYGLCQSSTLPVLHAAEIQALLLHANTHQRTYVAVDERQGYFLQLFYDRLSQDVPTEATVYVTNVLVSPCFAEETETAKRKRGGGGGVSFCDAKAAKRV
tara:strand:- start:158 stop:562 length:405 start_codon:yes stop_codon:yes gene_type:complete